MRRLAAVALALAAIAGCEGYNEGPYPIEQSTWLIGVPKEGDNAKADVVVDIYANRDDCVNAKEVDDTDLCVPMVDRASGQVRFSFGIKGTDGNVAHLSLNQESVEFAHFDRMLKPEYWDLEPHAPIGASQLFIIIVDGSASIYKTGGITKVKRALLDKQVVDSFLPKGQTGVHNGVMLLRFSVDLETMDGKDPLKDAVIFEKQKDYIDFVDAHLENKGKAGFSHVYEAVAKASTKLVQTETVRNWLGMASAEPTIVLLTDGFNNEKGDDTCATNVPRLVDSLNTVQRAASQGGKSRLRVFTVGLGTPMSSGFVMPPGGVEAITDKVICKSDQNGYYGDRIIDNSYAVGQGSSQGLEEVGIDNQSLTYIAFAGGGKSYVENTDKGLAKVFLAAAAQKYGWYTVRSRQDSFYQRRSFDARIRLRGGIQGESTVTFLPSPWLDAPSGTIPPGEMWFVPTPFRASLSPVTVIIGFLTALGFAGPAWFNARRALFRRARDK